MTKDDEGVSVEEELDAIAPPARDSLMDDLLGSADEDDPAPNSSRPSDPDAVASDEGAEGSSGETASDDEEAPVDQLGIPMSREPTLDDVRTDGAEHRRFAFGCSVLVTLFVVGFWVIRVVLLR